MQKQQVWKTPYLTPHEELRTTRLWLKTWDAVISDGILAGDIFFTFDSQNVDIPRYSGERFETRLRSLLGKTASIDMFMYDNRGCDDGCVRGNVRLTFETPDLELADMTFEEFRHALIALLDSIKISKFEDLPSKAAGIKLL